MDPSMRPKLQERYLELLGVPERSPSIAALGELVQAHLCRVPFETISKLYYKKHLGLQGVPRLGFFLDGIERFGFGGTCYTINSYFHQLLANLGYDVKLCGADMDDPDVHVVSMVDLDQRQYLVDVGYGAPFAAPLPRDLAEDHVIELGHSRYVLEPQDADGCSRLQSYRDGEWQHGYVAKPAPRRISDFESAIADSYRDEATFMNAILLARFFPDRSLVIRNRTFTESRGTTSSTRKLADIDELVDVVSECFGIPGPFTRDALGALTAFGKGMDGQPAPLDDGGMVPTTDGEAT